LVVVTTLMLGISGKRARDKEAQDYKKIMEEYLLRTFDGGSRKDGGVEGVIDEEDENMDVDVFDNGNLEAEIRPIGLVDVGRLDADIVSEAGSGEEAGETNISDNDDDSETNDSDIAVSDDSTVIEGSGEEEESSSSGEEESVVLDSAPYSMVSLDGETTVNIILQRVSDSDLLNMVCDVATENSDLFKESGCVPQIYMVSGVNSCSSLPTEFSAKKLADVHGEGVDELFVDATWTELPGKCLVLLKPTSCDSDGVGESSDAEVIDVGEEGSGVEGSAESREIQQSRSSGILRSAGFGRSYGIISLSSFTLLSSGSSTVFSISKPAKKIFGGVVPGIVSTPYDKFSTLPYLQLPGWTATDAILIALSMLVLYYGYAYVTAESISLEPLKRRLFSESQIERVDALQNGLEAITDTYLLSMSNPWKNILENIDKNLLKQDSSNYVNKNKLLRKRGKPLVSSPKMGSKSGDYREKAGWQRLWESRRNSLGYKS